MKKSLTVLLVICMILAAASSVLPFAIFDKPDIIGGAGSPTMQFYMRTHIGQILLLIKLFSYAGIISWGLGRLVFNSFFAKHALLSLGASLSVAAGLNCMLLFAGCFIMTSPSRHPVALPTSVVGGCIAALLLWIFSKQLVNALKITKSKKAVFLSAVTFTAHLLPFAYLLSFAYSVLRELLK